MIQNVNEYVDFLIKNNISQDQFLLCFLLYTDSVRELPDGRRKYIDSKSKQHPVAKMYEYMDFIHKKSNRKAWTTEDVQDLIDKGFLKIPPSLNNLPNKPSPDILILTDKFVDALFATNDQFEKFWKTYPGFIENFSIPNGKMIKLKAVDKEELRRRFQKIIVTKKEFSVMMEALNWSIEKGLINMNIEKYLTSRQWEIDIEYRNHQHSDTSSGYGLEQA